MMASSPRADRKPWTLPLFPLRTVLFPGGLLPLKIFETRYVEMTKACLKDDRPFGVCLLTRGDERVSVAILTFEDGSHAYGKETLRGIAKRLLREL